MIAMVKFLRDNTALIRVIDAAVRFLWSAHLVIMFWRGTLELYDLYILPGDTFTGAWISWCCGILLRTSVHACYPYLRKRFKPSDGVRYVFVSRLCIYLLAIATTNIYRGVWRLQNHYMDLTWQSNLPCFALGLGTLWLIRSSPNFLTPPMSNGCDLQEDLFVSRPRLRTDPDESFWNYVVDHMFSQVIVFGLVVTCWRSLWNVVEDAILPDHFWASNLLTWWGGYALGAVLLLLQGPSSRLSQRLRKRHIVLQLMFENILVLLAFFVCVTTWRGWWNVLAVKLIPDKLIGGIICHVVGYLGVVLTCCSNNLFVGAFAVDGENPMGIQWNFHYTEHFLDLSVKPSTSNGNTKQDENVLSDINGNEQKCGSTMP